MELLAVLSLLEYSDPSRQTLNNVSLKYIRSGCGRVKLLFKRPQSLCISGLSPSLTAGRYNITSLSRSLQL